MSASRAIMTPSRTDFEANLASPRSLKEDVEQFLYRQSEFLDNRDWDAWLDLFAPTGIYWIAAHPDDPSPDGRPCICCEDRYLMRTRIKRLRNPKAWSQLPPHRTSHVVSNVSIVEAGSESGSIVVQSRFHMVELRWDKQRYDGTLPAPSRSGRRGFQDQPAKGRLVELRCAVGLCATVVGLG